ncbi:MAG: hypothetical protein L3J82_04700, partial [Planctomycetes bacterium]|nr:hypothetical protein [Planctomycetota bacterium]
RRALFILEVEIEQRESEPYSVSAKDFYDSGQLVQAMVKYRTIVNKFPRCARGVTAKEGTLKLARKFLDKMEELKGNSLDNIAMDRAIVARMLLDLVEKNLLKNILSVSELAWIHELRTEDGNPNTLPNREADLDDLLTQLRKRLPANMPEKKIDDEDSNNGGND